MTLSPLSPSALNAKSPSPLSCAASLDVTASHKMVSTTSKPETPIYEDDEIQWDEEPSSPFQSQLPLEERQRIASLEMAPVREASETLELDMPSPSPRKTSHKSDDLIPFEILEDDTAGMPAPPAALSRMNKRKSASPIKNNRSNGYDGLGPDKQFFKEERVETLQESSYSFNSATCAQTTPRLGRQITSTVHEEMYKRAQTVAGSMSASSNTDLLMGGQSVNEVIEESLIDDSCFSTFSQVPNLDMTKFSKLAKQSPTKPLLSGVSCYAGCSKDGTDNIRHHEEQCTAQEIHQMRLYPAYLLAPRLPLQRHTNVPITIPRIYFLISLHNLKPLAQSQISSVQYPAVRCHH